LIGQCAEVAVIHDDIVAMPMGYNSLIGDVGTTLSGGQKQRILLARALYNKPRLLFLDEATTHLDSPLEDVVNQNTSALRLTRILIAHRPETIESADRIALLQRGNIYLANSPKPSEISTLNPS